VHADTAASEGIPEVPRDRVGFLVVGTPRSGTTLVQRLACEIEGVRMPPETHFFSDFAWDLFFRKWFPIGERALREEIERYTALENSKGLDIDVEALVADLGGRCASMYDLFDAIVRHLSGPARVWGEKTPGHLLWWPAIAQAAPWMRFVVVVRDPRAVVASILSMPWTSEGELSSWGENIHLALAARWAFDQKLAQLMQRHLGPSRCLVIRYEDCVRQPDAARARIARLVGLAEGVSHQTPPENMVLPWEDWKKRALGDVTLDRVESWRAELGAERATEVALLCRSGMLGLGYRGVPGLVAGAVRRNKIRKQSGERLEQLMAVDRNYASLVARVQLY